MRIATWNINSIRARHDRVLAWLERSDVDVLAIQETKIDDARFPVESFERLGYRVAHHGTNQWNGVAIASRSPMTDVATSFDGMPGFKKGLEGPGQPLEARALGVTVEGLRL